MHRRAFLRALCALEIPMEYAAIAVAILGFAVGTLFRLQVLSAVIVMLLFFSVVYSFSSGLNLLGGLLTITTVQTIVQVCYFFGLIVRAALEPRISQHIL